jgi:hypothetical protein
MSDLTSLATGLPSTRRVLVLIVHFHFDEMATVSRRQPPKPLPICEEPHNGVPTRSDWGRRPRDQKWSRGFSISGAIRARVRLDSLLEARWLPVLLRICCRDDVLLGRAAGPPPPTSVGSCRFFSRVR